MHSGGVSLTIDLKVGRQRLHLLSSTARQCGSRGTSFSSFSRLLLVAWKRASRDFVLYQRVEYDR